MPHISRPSLSIVVALCLLGCGIAPSPDPRPEEDPPPCTGAECQPEEPDPCEPVFDLGPKSPPDGYKTEPGAVVGHEACGRVPIGCDDVTPLDLGYLWTDASAAPGSVFAQVTNEKTRESGLFAKQAGRFGATFKVGLKFRFPPVGGPPLSVVLTADLGEALPNQKFRVTLRHVVYQVKGKEPRTLDLGDRLKGGQITIVPRS